MHKPGAQDVDGSISNVWVFYALVACLALVICANINMFIHIEHYPRLLSITILLLGVMYSIGFPLGMRMHAYRFVTVSWNNTSLFVTHYLSLLERTVEIKWIDIVSVKIN